MPVLAIDSIYLANKNKIYKNSELLQLTSMMEIAEKMAKVVSFANDAKMYSKHFVRRREFAIKRVFKAFAVFSFVEVIRTAEPIRIFNFEATMRINSPRVERNPNECAS